MTKREPKKERKRNGERNRLERLRKSNVSQSIILFGWTSVPRHIHVGVQFIDDTQVVQFVQPLLCVRVVLLNQIFHRKHCSLLQLDVTIGLPNKKKFSLLYCYHSFDNQEHYTHHEL